MFSSKSFYPLIFVCALVLTNPLLAQENVATGVVRDKNTYQQIRSVNIFVKGSKTGTTTDLSGKYRLRVPGSRGDLENRDVSVVVFQHIAYYEREIPVTQLLKMDRIYLQPRVIPLSSVEIEEEGVRHLEIEKDLPQAVSVIESRDFEIRGYVDAGDLLRIDNSVQVDEDLSGSKTVSIRGGNPDEVIILFNGVKMNNAYNNVFDLSLIDLEDVERFELIKGSNTALYGPEAFSGVVNIVPKVEQDYTIRFQQRVGTYRSGNWGLHFYKRFNRLYGSYSIKRGGFGRSFVNDGGNLENSSLHHTATLNYDVGANEVGRPAGTLSAMWIYSSLDYRQEERGEPVGTGEENAIEFTNDIENFNNMISLKYSGQLFGQEGFDLSTSYKNLDQDQLVLNRADAPRMREILDRAFLLNVQKQFQISKVDLLFAYQFQMSELEQLDENVGQDLGRTHHGAVSILKYHGDTGSDFFQSMDLDLSIRHDRVQDKQENVEFFGEFGDRGGFGLFADNAWNATNFKFSVSLAGYRENLSLKSYFNFGANTKFPTLFQQISSADPLASGATTPNLSPEKNRSFEFGITVGKDVREHTSIYGWQVSGSYFQNHYDNKFRMFITQITDPTPSFDNVQNANISGFEGRAIAFLFKKKISAELGISKYFLSDQSSFPFKSDNKKSLTVSIDHAGYAFQLYWFREGDQVALLRNFGTGEFNSEVQGLPSQTNLDVHLSKTFEISKLRFFANASGRNLLNDEDTVLRGLAIRDRRFYLTVGVQY
ncbi:MAG: TonB-dependent receptor plug domain-containing protein [bacterium]